MSTDWSQFRSFEDWGRKLGELLARASQAADDASRGGVSRELLEFADEAPAGLAGAGELKRRAREAIRDLAAADLQAGLASLRSRSQDLSAQLQLIREVTAQANKEAASLKLQNLDSFIRSAGDTVAALKEARASLCAGADLPTAVAKIDQGITTLETLRGSLQKLTS